MNQMQDVMVLLYEHEQNELIHQRQKEIVVLCLTGLAEREEVPTLSSPGPGLLFRLGMPVCTGL